MNNSVLKTLGETEVDFLGGRWVEGSWVVTWNELSSRVVWRVWGRGAPAQGDRPEWEDNGAVPTELETGAGCQRPNGVRRAV